MRHTATSPLVLDLIRLTQSESYGTKSNFHRWVNKIQNNGRCISWNFRDESAWLYASYGHVLDIIRLSQSASCGTKSNFHHRVNKIRNNGRCISWNFPGWVSMVICIIQPRPPCPWNRSKTVAVLSISIYSRTHRKRSQSSYLKLGTGCRPNWKRQPVPLTVSTALSKHFISVCLRLWNTCQLTSVMRHRSDCRGRNRNNCCICIWH